MRCLEDLWASTIHVYRVFRVLEFLVPIIHMSLVTLGNLNGMTDSNVNSNFFRAIFHGVLELIVIQIDTRDSCQFASIALLRLSNSPMTFFFVLSAFAHI